MNSINVSVPKCDYSVSEAYKSLRTNLLFCGDDKKVIALTSCNPNEGKSSVSLNLAVSMAEAGKKVLLIDADLRKSVLMGTMKVKDAVNGLTHYLSKQASLLDVIYATNISKLHVAFAGPTPPNPAELLGGKAFQDMINSVRKAYDYILIDTPPLGNVIDSVIIAKQCDGVIMVVESEAISYRFARGVKEQIEKSNCPILGVVLNKVDMSKQGYYGKYGRYGKYGKYAKYGKYGTEDEN